MSSSIRAAVVTAPGGLPEVVDVDVAAVAADEVLVRIESSGICHTDLAYAAGDFYPHFPVVLGHEFAGVVEAVGDRVTRVRAGDRVVYARDRHCGRCRHCEAGHVVLCESEAVRTGPPRLSRDGEPVVQAVGGFAEKTVLGEISVVRVPEGVPSDIAALMGCAVASGAGAVFNVARIRPGAQVLILGAGGVGLSAVVAARAAGAERLLVVDPDASRRQLAATLGATDVLPADEGAIREAVPDGVSTVLECAGTVGAMELALRLTARGGATVLMGAPKPGTTIAVDVLELLLGQRRVLTCLGGDIRPNTDFDRLFRMYLRGSLDVDRLVTGHVTLEGIGEGFTAAADRVGIRTLVHP